MVSTFTPNLQIEQPARNDDIGTWDTPVNTNATILDLVGGAITTIGLNNANVVLSGAQFRSKQITFNSTLTGSVTITFPTSFTKSYEIQNLCTGSSAFQVQLLTTAAGGQVIACPPGETVDCFNDGVNLKFKNLGRIGSFWDYAGSAFPTWVNFCTIPPYLNCDGTSFSSATYPVLTNILNGTTLPDIRGTTRYTLNQGTGRLTTALGGIDGNTNFSLKTTQATIGTSNLPPYTPAGSVICTQAANATLQFPAQSGAAVGVGGTESGGSFTQPMSFLFTGTAQGGVSNVMPVGSATVAGLCLIRAG